ncbi:unnamed protein product [Linum trigynum]|uniref:Fe2OG dioxygenase domain-containing protein n=1 Tax=Linum trigynum TaxID=586398 RepID=A0AAV2DJ15_9ROSI
MRVQSIAQAGKSEVPPQYIQPPSDRPNSDADGKSGSGGGVPVIDLGEDSVREAVGRACRDWGAFQGLFRPSHFASLSRRNPSNWPHYPPNYREVVSQYSDEMNVLAQKLLGIISESLGLPPSCLKDAVGEFYQNITVMLKDSHWYTVDPLPEAIVVLVSDQTEIITNGNYRSAVHRAVTNSTGARLSVATFHDPSNTRNISPAAVIVAQSSPPRYREVNYGDYMSRWYTKGPEGKRNIDSLLIGP